jgi:hypothetical protein
MTAPAVQQLLETLHQLEGFGICSPDGRQGLPQLPAPVDDVLIEHLARGLLAAVRIRAVGAAVAAPAEVATTVEELRAAVALLQEWVVTP